MNPRENNPFESGTDRHQLWEMLVRSDIDAFLNGDWDAVAGDFCSERFFALDARFKADPDDWKPGFPTLDAYRDSWLSQSREFTTTEWAEDPRAALFAATDLTQIEVCGDAALLHKKFGGSITRADGIVVPLAWQTLYHCRKLAGRWRIAGFTGYLPRPEMPSSKRLPPGARQHITAGPCSPVLEIDGSRLVVISGQAAILPDGSIPGDSIVEQTELTLNRVPATD